MTDRPIDPPSRSIELQIVVDAPVSVVWRALTNAEELARWFPPIAGGSGSAHGDSLLISWGGGIEWRTTVGAVDPERHVQWLDDPDAYAKSISGESDKPAVAVDWFIETRGGKTVVRLVHSGFGASSDWNDQFDATKAGWQYFLFNLREYLERHLGTPRVLVSERRKSPVSREDLWARLMGPQGVSIADGTADVLTVGETRSATLGTASYAARVEHAAAPSHLWLRFPGLSDAILFVEAESGRENFSCGLWLSTYGLPNDTVEQLRDGLRAVADRVFAPAS